jgi:D-alanyl-lipoteichoic acid acyltransferase DltB (MBOAT superfamily)
MEMVNVNWALIVPILVIQFIVLIIAIIDLARIEKTKGPKWMWAIIILFFNGLCIGSILYFVIGRRSY